MLHGSFQLGYKSPGTRRPDVQRLHEGPWTVDVVVYPALYTRHVDPTGGQFGQERTAGTLHAKTGQGDVLISEGR